MASVLGEGKIRPMTNHSENSTKAQDIMPWSGGGNRAFVIMALVMSGHVGLSTTQTQNAQVQKRPCSTRARVSYFSHCFSVARHPTSHRHLRPPSAVRLASSHPKLPHQARATATASVAMSGETDTGERCAVTFPVPSLPVSADAAAHSLAVLVAVATVRR